MDHYDDYEVCVFDRNRVFDCKLITIYEVLCIVCYMVLYTLFYTTSSVKMCAIDMCLSVSLSIAESLNSAVSLNSAAIVTVTHEVVKTAIYKYYLFSGRTNEVF